MGKNKPKSLTRRQHTIPRMLLKRFASRVEVSEVYTWQFRHKAKPFETNIKNASVETYFYGNADNRVEDSLGAAESRHSAVLDEVLSGKDLNGFENELRELVWMLAIRTGNFRRNMGDVLVGGIDEMIEQADRDTVRHMFAEQLDMNLDTMLNDMIGKLPSVPARALRVSLERRPALRDKIRRVVDILADADDAAGAFRSILCAAKTQVDFKKVASDSHVRSLEKLTDGCNVPDSFRPEHWQLIRTSPKRVVLGDGTCFAVGADDDPGHLLRFSQDWEEIYVPVAHDAILVGSQSIRPARYTIDRINLASASLSYDQFFAAENGEKQRSLVDSIRSGTATLTPDEIREAVKGAWKSSSAPRKEDESSRKHFS